MKIKLLFLGILLFCFVSCKPDRDYRSFQFTHFALGTVIEVTFLVKAEGSFPEDTVKAIASEVFNIFDRIDSTFYEGNKKSFIYEFNNLNKGQYISLPTDLFYLVKRSFELSQQTQGTFDITTGTYLPLYPFEKNRKHPPDIDSLIFLSKFTGYNNLLLDTTNMCIGKKNDYLRLSLGGIAKGYAVDQAVNFLKQCTVVKGAIVNAGGDIGISERADRKPWRIGIRHPRETGKLLGIIEVKSGAVATSGDYEKFYILQGKRYHHILDPATGFPGDKCQSVTVIAPRAEIADALATGLFIAGAKKGRELLKNFPLCEALWVDSSGIVHTSNGFRKYISEKFW